MTGGVQKRSVGFTPAQIRILVLCTVAALVEGYDTQMIGYVAPVISRQWALAPGAFRWTFSVGLLGLMLGSLVIAPLADRVGRKWVIIGSTFAYALLVLASAMARDLTTLFWLRFFTGLGLGGGLPNIAALAGESSPRQWRATAVAILFCGFGLGGAVAGFTAARLMGPYGWPSVFAVGGAAALVLVPVLWLGLPLPASTAARAELPSRRALPVSDLFRVGRARATVALWIVNFMGLMDLYLLVSWLPTTISAQGISVARAAAITALMQFGGIVGAFVLGPAVDRLGPNPVLPAAYGLAALCIAGIGLAGSSEALVTVAVLGAGFGIIGCQDCNSGVAVKLYPARMRSTGVGWALGVGRAGSIIGPFVAGGLLATGVDLRIIFLFSAVPALLAAVAYLAMGRRPEFAAGASEGGAEQHVDVPVAP